MIKGSERNAGPPRWEGRRNTTKAEGTVRYSTNLSKTLALRHHGITRPFSFFLVQLESSPRSLRLFSQIVCAHGSVEVLGEDANQLEMILPAADGRVPTLHPGVDLAHVAVLNLLRAEHEDRLLTNTARPLLPFPQYRASNGAFQQFYFDGDARLGLRNTSGRRGRGGTRKIRHQSRETPTNAQGKAQTFSHEDA